MLKHDAMLVLKRLFADERFAWISPTARHVLTTAIVEWMGGDGWFWPSRALWAKATGLSTRTIDRVINDLLAVGLITKQEYRRPPGGPHGGKTGSPNFRLDPALLSQGATSVSAPVGTTSSSPSQGATSASHGEGPTRGDIRVATERSRRTTSPRVRARPGGRHRAGAGKANLRCPVCDVERSSQSKLDDHLANVHDLPPASEST